MRKDNPICELCKLVLTDGDSIDMCDCPENLCCIECEKQNEECNSAQYVCRNIEYFLMSERFESYAKVNPKLYELFSKTKTGDYIMKKKKSTEGKGLVIGEFKDIESIEILIDDETDEYDGVAITKKDGTIQPFTPKNISMEDAEKLINEFDEFKQKEISKEAKPIQIEKGDLFQIKNKQTNKIFSVVVLELALLMNSKEEITFEVIQTGETIRVYSTELLKEYEVKRIEKIDSFEKPKEKVKQTAFDLAIEERLLNDIRDGKIESIEYHKDDSEVIDGINIVYKNEFYDKGDTIDCVLGNDKTTKVIMTAFKEFQNKPAESTPEPEKINTAKNMEYTHKLTPEELVRIADEQNRLIEDNINLENELEGYKNTINPQIKANEKEISKLHSQYSTKIVTRTETIEPEIDWKKGVMHYLHPETKAILEELPIPQDLRQQSLGFDKSDKKQDWVINPNFNRDNLSPLHEGIYHLLFAGIAPKNLIEYFAHKMPTTASNIRDHVKNSFSSHPGCGGPTRNGKPSYRFDSEPKGLTLKYQIGDDEQKILKGKELCQVAANVLNQIIIQPEFEQFVELTSEPDPKESKPDETTKDFYFEYFKLYQGVEFPKGVTPTRIDKVKDVIINSDFFDELIFDAKQDGSKKFQNECAKNFFDYCSDVLKGKGIIKVY